MKKTLKRVAAGSMYLMPFLAFAQSFEDALGTINDILRLFVPILITLAIIYFFYGLAKYILSAGSDESKAEGRNIMIYGIIALFIMVSVWGIVGLLQETFDVSNEDSADVVGDIDNLVPDVSN